MRTDRVAVEANRRDAAAQGIVGYTVDSYLFVDRRTVKSRMVQRSRIPGVGIKSKSKSVF